MMDTAKVRVMEILMTMVEFWKMLAASFLSMDYGKLPVIGGLVDATAKKFQLTMASLKVSQEIETGEQRAEAESTRARVPEWKLKQKLKNRRRSKGQRLQKASGNSSAGFKGSGAMFGGGLDERLNRSAKRRHVILKKNSLRLIKQVKDLEMGNKTLRSKVREYEAEIGQFVTDLTIMKVENQFFKEKLRQLTTASWEQVGIGSADKSTQLKTSLQEWVMTHVKNREYNPNVENLLYSKTASKKSLMKLGPDSKKSEANCKEKKMKRGGFLKRIFCMCAKD